MEVSGLDLLSIPEKLVNEEQGERTEERSREESRTQVEPELSDPQPQQPVQALTSPASCLRGSHGSQPRAFPALLPRVGSGFQVTPSCPRRADELTWPSRPPPSVT